MQKGVLEVCVVGGKCYVGICVGIQGHVLNIETCLCVCVCEGGKGDGLVMYVFVSLW